MKLCLPRANPFAVDAWFDYSCTLTFAVQREEIATRLPSCLEPDTFDDQWGFVAVAVVQTRHLRPAGFPRSLGHDFVLVGYRYFVRYRSASGRNLRGLYILRSETDKKRMELLGNIFTRYRYVETGVRVTEENERLRIESPTNGSCDRGGSTRSKVRSRRARRSSRWEDARKFSGPLPFTFTCEAEKKRVLIVEGVRSDWKPKPVRVLGHDIPFLSELGHGNAILANAFVVREHSRITGRKEPPNHGQTLETQAFPGRLDHHPVQLASSCLRARRHGDPAHGRGISNRLNGGDLAWCSPCRPRFH